MILFVFDKPSLLKMTLLSQHLLDPTAAVILSVLAAFMSESVQSLTLPTSVRSTSTTNPISLRINHTESITNRSDLRVTNTTVSCTNTTASSFNHVQSDVPAASVPKPTTVSKEVYERMMTSMDTFTLYFELVSVFCTFVSSFIYALADMRCATAYYLVGLNVVDTISGIFVVIRNIWQAVDKAEAMSAAGFHYLTIYGSLFITVSCRRMVYCFFLMLSAERFFVISFPLKARYMKIIRFPKFCILALVLFIQTYHVYLPLKYKVAPSPRGQGFIMTYSDLFRARKEMFADVSNAGKVLFSYIPLALCMLLSVGLIIALRRHQTSRESLQETQPSNPQAQKTAGAERQLARTIWLSTLLFTLLSLPSNTAQIVASYHNTFRFLGFEHRLYRLVGRFAYVALISTRYTNFLAYLGLSTAFRRNFLRLTRLEKVVRKMKRKGDNKSESSVGGRKSLSSTTQVSVVSSPGL